VGIAFDPKQRAPTRWRLSVSLPLDPRPALRIGIGPRLDDRLIVASHLIQKREIVGANTQVTKWPDRLLTGAFGGLVDDSAALARRVLLKRRAWEEVEHPHPTTGIAARPTR